MYGSVIVYPIIGPISDITLHVIHKCCIICCIEQYIVYHIAYAVLYILNQMYIICHMQCHMSIYIIYIKYHMYYFICYILHYIILQYTSIQYIILNMLCAYCILYLFYDMLHNALLYTSYCLCYIPSSDGKFSAM